MTQPLPYEERIRWFHKARFGLFIHYGLYSLLERGEWVMFRERIPLAEYEALADSFHADAFNADAIAGLARAAGMRYAVLTARHHEGFCLWDSKVTSFTSMQRGPRRDLVREFVEACRRHGLHVGIYISNKDWREPGYWEPEKHPESAQHMVQQLHAMTEELLTDYGKIDLLWFDGAWVDVGRKSVESVPAFWQAERLLKRIYELQPHILVNNRLGLPADLDTPEQQVTASDHGRGWETCMTIGDPGAWGYCRHNPNRKTLAQLLQNLSKTAAGEGNYILNVGPRGDGSIPEADSLLLRQMGDWLQVHGDAIYESKRFNTDKTWYNQGVFSRQGNRVYLHVFRWSGSQVVVPLFERPPREARLLTTGQLLDIETAENGRIVLSGLPLLPPHPCQSVIEMTFEQPPSLRDESDHAAWLKGMV